MVIRSNELKHKIKMLSIHRAIFHNGVKQKVLVNVYTRTWWKIPDIKLLVRRLELRRTSYLWMNCATKTYWDFFFLNKNSSFNNYLSFITETIKHSKTGYLEVILRMTAKDFFKYNYFWMKIILKDITCI